MSCSTSDEEPDDPTELGDFDPGLSEQRGEQDIALFFDQRLMRGMNAEDYVVSLMARVGSSFQGRWTRFGYFRSAMMSNKELLELLTSEVSVPEDFDFPSSDVPLAIVQLDGLPARARDYGLAVIRKDPAFVEAVDVSFVTDLRVLLSRALEWL